MIKVADKPSQDPIQQKLRMAKKQWNKDVSAFIDDLIHYKKLTNGQPSKFHNEKSSIKDPIPADPATILGSLANDFQELVQRGNAIITSQIEYSKTRRKKQIKAPVSTTPTSTPDLSAQLASFKDYNLISEGSNPITRFFTKLFNPTMGFGNSADLRRARMSMLDYCANSYKKLGKFQVQVLKSSKDSIPEANKILHEAWSDWILVSRAYVIFKNSKSVNAADKGGAIENQMVAQDLAEEKEIENINKFVENLEDKKDESIKENLIVPSDKYLDQQPEENESVSKSDISNLYMLEKAKNIAMDYKRYNELLPLSNIGRHDELEAAVYKFIATKGKVIDPEIIKYYEESIRDLNNQSGTTGTSFKDIVTQLKSKVKNDLNPKKPSKNEIKAHYIPTIEKVSQDFLKKWIGKTLHQLSLTDRTSSHRLNSYKLAGEIRKEINQVMNFLEKGLNENELDPLIKKINSQIVSLRGIMRSLYLSSGKI